MYPVINVFGKTFGVYSIFSIIGMLAAGFVFIRSARKRYGIIMEDSILYGLCILGGIIIGGHLMYALTNFDVLVMTFSDIFSVPFGRTLKRFGFLVQGSVFYGGLIGCIIATMIYTKHSKAFTRRQAFDLFAVAAPLFHGFARIGCFFGGCCYGVKCSFGFSSHANPYVPDVVGVQRFPVQLLEALCNFLLFFVMLYLFQKRKAEGRLMFVYLYSYAFIRFFDEFLRGDAYRGFIIGLSTSQFISILIVAVSTVILLILDRRSKRRKGII